MKTIGIISGIGLINMLLFDKELAKIAPLWFLCITAEFLALCLIVAIIKDIVE